MAPPLPAVVVALAGFAVATAQEPPLLTKVRAASERGPLVVAHRGASEDAPENTVAALRAATALAADVVELDVRQTRDGAWVCMHDATLDRTTDAEKKHGRRDVRVDALTLAQVRELDAGTWKARRFAGEKVPTLAEALAAVGDAIPMVERKAGDAAAFVAELRRQRAVERVIVQSFDHDWLEAVHRAEPKLLLAALGDEEPTKARLAAARRTGARIVHWSHRTLGVEAAAAVRADGMLLCAYTCDPDVLALGAAAIGCDLITTNRPGRLLALRRDGRLRRP
jgi:glycerophosphoryl diester phosphodiesterase